MMNVLVSSVSNPQKQFSISSALPRVDLSHHAYISIYMIYILYKICIVIYIMHVLHMHLFNNKYKNLQTQLLLKTMKIAEQLFEF